MHTERSDIALFIFAHQDDEYSAAPWIAHEISCRRRPICVYLTDGASRTNADVRDAESTAVLLGLGVPPCDIFFLGSANRISDGALPQDISRGYQMLEEWSARHPGPVVMYAPDWEGGHPDHDAAHMIALRFAHERRVPDIWGFSLYNSYRCIRPFFSSLRSLPGGERRTVTHDVASGWRLASLCWQYPSQRRTWIGLFPGAFIQRVLLRSETVRRADVSRLRSRPHAGVLLYERLFGTRYDQFRALTSEFMEQINRASLV